MEADIAILYADVDPDLLDRARRQLPVNVELIDVSGINDSRFNVNARMTSVAYARVYVDVIDSLQQYEFIAYVDADIYFGRSPNHLFYSSKGQWPV